MSMNVQTSDTGYELRFRSLFDQGRYYAFPCDKDGLVDLDSLGERLLNSYFYARSLVGREVAAPTIAKS